MKPWFIVIIMITTLIETDKSLTQTNLATEMLNSLGLKNFPPPSWGLAFQYASSNSSYSASSMNLDPSGRIDTVPGRNS